MSQKIAELEIVIHDQASEAATKVDNLADAAKKLGGTAKGINDVASGMTKLDKATGSTGADKLKNAVSAIEENVKNLSDALDQAQKKISNFGSADIKTNIPEVGKQAEGIKSATKGAADGIKEVSEKSNEAKSSVDRFSAGLSYAGSVLKNMRHILPGVVNQLTRMVKMRILRTIVKNFLAGVTEGLQNVYNWASMVGNGFKATMDGMVSSSLYLKNSIGAAFASLLSLIAPSINSLVDMIVDAINYVNMFFAVLSGKSTYTRAKKVAVEYGKAASGAIGGAAGAAKELKEQLSVLDFDELNQLADQPTPSSGGGGGGGGGAAGTDVADMFETAKVTSNALTNAATWIKENFEDVLDIVKSIGAGILAWKLSDTLLGDVLSLRQLAGIAIAVTGFTLEFEGAKAIGRGDADFMDWLKAGIGAALGIAGSLMTFGLIPAGFLIGIGLAITMFITGVTVGKMEAFRDELLKTNEDYKYTADIVEQSVDRINTANSRIMQVKMQSPMDNEEYKKWTYASDILKKIQGFEGVKVNNANLGELQSYIDELNGILEAAGLDAFVQYWVDADDIIRTNVDDIQDVIDKMLELARFDALKDLVSENLKGIYEAETENRTYTAENERSQSIIDQYQPTVDAYNERMKQGRIYLTADEEKEFTEAQLQVDQATEAIKRNNEAMDANNEYIALATELNSYYEEELYGVTDALLAEIEAIDTLTGMKPELEFSSGTNTPQNWRIGNNAHLEQQYQEITGNGGLNLFADASKNAGFARQYENALDGVASATEGTTEASNGLNGVWTNVPQIGGSVVNTTETMSTGFGELGKTMQGTTSDANSTTYALRQIGTGLKLGDIRKDIQGNFAPQYFTETAKGVKKTFEDTLNNIGGDMNYSTIMSNINTGLSKAQASTPFSNIGVSIGGNIQSGSTSGFNSGTVMTSYKTGLTNNQKNGGFSSIGSSMGGDIQNGAYNGFSSAYIIAAYLSGLTDKQKNASFSGVGGSIGGDMQSGAYNGFSSKYIIGAYLQGLLDAEYNASFSSIGQAIGYDIKNGIAAAIQTINFSTTAAVAGVYRTISGSATTYLGYATGGYPEAGTLFVAGEAGAEAVGTINGKTGVANRDQIASAIAMALQPMLGSGGSTTTNVNVQMDSRSVARASLKGQRAMNRQFNITAQA